MIPSQPSHTASRVALRRAAHQLLDVPPVLVDPLAIPILGPAAAAALRAEPAQFENSPFAAPLRAFMAARSRFAEDQLARLRAAGIGQYVVLGAGLDTSACRDPSPELPLRVWEVDHPATQSWKRERLAEAGIPIPEGLTFVPVDFEQQSLDEALLAAGLDPAAGAFFSWLGVTPYLTRSALEVTLRFIASATQAGGGVVFDYALDPRGLTPRQRSVFEALAERVRQAGEPWQSWFEPSELVRELLAMGFAVAEDVPAAALNERYFAGRSDGLQVGGLAHLMWAGARTSPTARRPQSSP